MTVLLFRPDLGKKAYRLKCRFVIEAFPTQDWLDKKKIETAERFVSDMKKQGWEYDPNKIVPSERGFKLRGPFQATPVMVLPKAPRIIPNHEALARVKAGDLMRDTGEDYAVTVPILSESAQWEYEISAVFIRSTILVETPDKHEELEVIRN